ncbi:hypothetical protein JB92DRAFT_2899627 [Gautieria morchelliformis]|nr:hypothetical protein JB92DRAFT_2899627 [Gautieria morchelliformis]
MQFTTTSVFFVLLAVLSTAWSTVALPVLQARDVFDPPITSPKAGDVFTAGQTITVTWDTSSIPAGTPNEGELVLGRLEANSENLDIDHPLATGFLLTDGYHEITFPYNLTTASNYILDLFGDSGNISPTFTINAVGY